MNLRVRFSIIVAVIITVTIVLSSLVSLHFLYNIYQLLANAPNHGIAVTMAYRIFIRAALSYSIMILCLIALSIPVSIWFSKLVSRPYFTLIKHLYDNACDRLKIDTSVKLQKNERAVLQQYVDLLQADVIKLQDYEKIKSWKDGARLLMHEIKNPLTPLKLSAQKLTLQSENHPCNRADICRINTSVNDIENIMRYFKELVNVEFEKKQTLNIVPLFNNFVEEYNKNYYTINRKGCFSNQSIMISAQDTLLRMLFSNLVQNGSEQNREAFYLEVNNSNEHVHIKFITPDAVIEDIDTIFKLAYSTKGTSRGYGLFLCKMITDYLSISLSVENTPIGVVFTTVIPIIA